MRFALTFSVVLLTRALRSRSRSLRSLKLRILRSHLARSARVRFSLTTLFEIKSVSQIDLKCSKTRRNAKKVSPAVLLSRLAPSSFALGFLVTLHSGALCFALSFLVALLSPASLRSRTISKKKNYVSIDSKCYETHKNVKKVSHTGLLGRFAPSGFVLRACILSRFAS